MNKTNIEDLYHHGIKGQKWGVRRYQNEDGSLTPKGRARYLMNDVNDIVDTMSIKDKEYLNLTSDKYQTSENADNLVKRFVMKQGNVPVSFFDVRADDEGAAIAIGTRAGNEYRGKGYGKKVAAKGKAWLDKNAKNFNQVVWWVNKNNIPSIKTAEGIGFELDKDSVLPDDDWIMYKYKKA